VSALDAPTVACKTSRGRVAASRPPLPASQQQQAPSHAPQTPRSPPLFSSYATAEALLIPPVSTAASHLLPYSNATPVTVSPRALPSRHSHSAPQPGSPGHHPCLLPPHGGSSATHPTSQQQPQPPPYSPCCRSGGGGRSFRGATISGGGGGVE
ncbi:hypothetical protein Agub_g6191, partial [Astrephomene gubernaculifera]